MKEQILKVIMYSIRMSEATYGSIKENVDELIEDLISIGCGEIALKIETIVDDLPKEVNHEFIRRQWLIQLRKLYAQFNNRGDHGNAAH